MMDEEHDDGLGGRSRDRREVTEANRWAKPLCALSPAELAAAPVPEQVREQVRVANATREGRARNREHQRIDKLIRALDEGEVAEIDAFLADPGAGRRVLEGWVLRLVEDGDAALDLLLEVNPGADRQRLRTLTRNARKGGDKARAALLDALEELGPELTLPA
jgi:ribosome-associated protein